MIPDGGSVEAWRRSLSGLGVRLFFALTFSIAVSAPAVAEPSGTVPPNPTASSPAAAQPENLAALLAALPDADFDGKRDLIARMQDLHPPSLPRVLRALADGKLSQRDTDKRVFIVDDLAQDKSLIDPVTLLAVDGVDSDQLNRIVVNNSLRRFIRSVIAQASLNAEDAATRLAAAKEMQRDPNEETRAALTRRRAEEPDASVRKAIDYDLAVADLADADAAIRLKAIDTLGDSLDPDVYNRLQAMLQVGTDQAPAETDPRVRAAAERALHHIRNLRSTNRGVEMLFFGLSLGSVLVLAAIGLSITFGVMGVINMAHGELIMIGAYVTYVLQQAMPQHLAVATLLSIPAAFCVSGLIGVAIERCIVRFLYTRPLMTLLATFGISLILQQLVRSVFSPLNRSVATPEFMSGSLIVNDALSLTLNRLFIIVFMLIVFFALLLALRFTALGLKIRAVAQNRAMARAMGVRTQWVDAASFGLGSGVAGMAGVALSQITNVGPNLGQSYIVDSFMVVVFGGSGSLWGTLISGISLGVANTLLEPAVGAVLAKILVLVFLILFIQKKPRGLFPQRGRGAED